MIFRNVFKNELLAELQKVQLPAVKDVIIYTSTKNPTINRGFAFIEFESNRLATIARKSFRAGGLYLFGNPKIYVEWARPEPILQTLEMTQVNK